ncbi:M64 family metallopeptidase [Corallincola spongiicola]|uniref:Fibronectin type-III domain-containing protein n=1 Tax=Corallincola spongiicola TaxID=2520508 RepID=A0ABY1WRE9_9GAMM|nr:M64 family metallopeptidase [Corallincola spongiicola]TAA47173.1 hypothetical protein EXY25_07985 [Corallincola spongiicola]
MSIKRILLSLTLCFMSLTTSLSAAAQSRHITLELFNKQAGVQQRTNAPISSRTIDNKVSDATPRTSSQLTNEESQLLVVAVNKSGDALSETVIQNPLRKNVESFNPDTGEIEHAQVVELPKGVVDITLPESADIEQLIIYQQSEGKLVEIDRITVGKSTIKAQSRVAAMSDDVFPVLYNGDSDNRSDLIIVADGYTASEQGKFEQDVQRVVEGYFKEVPYNEYKKFYNVWGVKAVSAVSGAGVNGQQINNAFGGHFGCYGIDRLLCVDESKVQSYVRARMDANARDQILVVVNTTKYGGAGGTVATMSLASAAIDLALHEIGHSYGGLADEYDYGTCYGGEPSEPNSTSRRGQKWDYWSDISRVDWFEGSSYCATGKYRPTNNSMMRSLGQPFEEINNEVLVLKTYQYADAIDSFSPTQTSLSVDGSQRFELETVDPALSTQQITWYVDGSEVANGSQFTLSKNNYSDGSYLVKAVVQDSTNRVRRDPSNLLSDSISWTVTLSGDDTQCPELTDAPSGLTATQITTNAFTATWEPLADAKQYQIDLFSNDVWESFSTSATSYQFTGLAEGSDAQVRIKASNACSSTGFSAAVAIKLDDSQDCDVPQVVGQLAISAVTETSFNVSWDATQSSSSYLIQLWDEGAKKWVDHGTTQATELTITNLPSGTTQYVQVIALNACGDQASPSAWVTIELLTETQPCEALAAPEKPWATDITATGFTGQWNALAGAASYELQLWDEANRRWYAYTTTTDNQVQVTGQSGTSYFLIRGVNACGEPGEYSPWTEVKLTSQCTSAPAAPSMAVQGATVSWTKISGATSYELKRWTGSAWVDYMETAATSLQVTASTPTYLIVRATNSCGKSGYSNWVKAR